MLKTNLLTYQPSRFAVFSNKLIKYLRVGWMLHLASIISLIIGFVGLSMLVESIEFSTTNLIWSAFITSFGFSVFLISMIDAYGRFQNYKQMKDLFHKHGFDVRLIKPFMFSRCQRNAVLEAARSTNYLEKTQSFFKEKGYKWYHIFPDPFVKNPLVLFTVIFWRRILVTKYYEQQFFYW